MRHTDSDALKRIVEEGYDHVAQDYSRLEGKIEWPRMRWLDKLLSQLDSGSSVLDLGCGSGIPAAARIAKDHNVTGVDISKEQVSLARKNVPTGKFLHADAACVEFPSASYDAVVSFYTLEHIPRTEHRAVLSRISSWLRPKGLLLISIEAADIEGSTGEWLGVPMYISCFGPDSMKQLVKQSGFTLLESAIESQPEQGREIDYLWLLARKA